jgi:thioredoxin reductase (NADPH)
MVSKITKKDDNTFLVKTNENEYAAKSIIIATGSTPRRLYVDGYDKYWQKGISTCAVCDGGLPCFKGVNLVVVGGGDSACEEALHLTHTASKVYLVHRRDSLRASKIMQERVFSDPKIVMVWNSEVIKIEGLYTCECKLSQDYYHTNMCVEQVDKVFIKNIKTQEETILNVKGLFVAIGHDPNSQFVKDFVDCDKEGYIITNRRCETNIKGIWACGDVMDPHYKQAITAAGTGCMAALECERWLQHN